MPNISINLSETLFQQAQLVAKNMRKPIDEVVADALERNIAGFFQSSDLDELPSQMKEELEAMATLSDEA
jgi:hypothetical protein